ncbi:MAG: hypothetical protein AABZ60_11260, partial [Planctomycetota bacterium]
TLGGLYLNGYNENSLKIHPTVSRQDSVFRNKSAEIESEFSRLSDDDLALKYNAFILSEKSIGIQSIEFLYRAVKNSFCFSCFYEQCLKQYKFLVLLQGVLQWTC